MEKEKKTVLIVEDEKPLLDAIKIKLEKNNFETVSARSVEQAKQYTKDIERIDAIWLDHYLLGKEDGLDFVAWCKNDQNNKCNQIPIFVVSNTATSEKLATYMKLGVEKYFVKSNHGLEEIVDEIIKNLSE